MASARRTTGGAMDKICEGNGRGVFFPALGAEENTWDGTTRGLLYGVALLYCFLGVSIVADIFMQSIETITSKMKRVKLKGSGRYVTVYIWNSTVANLTLMALGSSAPEIMLTVIELFINDFFSGELGPFTIVGSAAFNLMVIIAVCVMSIPNGEVRYIQSVMVFRVTAIWSIFAYIWLVVIVEVNTPNVVSIWEGVVTFLFLPILVTNAYFVDKYEFRKRLWENVNQRKLMRQMSEFEEEASDEEPLTDLEQEEIRPMLVRHRSSGVRMLVAGRPKTSNRSSSRDSTLGESDSNEQKADSNVHFDGACFSVDTRQDSSLQLAVVRSGDVSREATVKYQTSDVHGSFKSDSNLLESYGEVHFEPHQFSKMIEISWKQVADGRHLGGYFKVELFEPTIVPNPAAAGATMPPTFALGKDNAAWILLLNQTMEGSHGVLTFGSDEVFLKGGSTKRKFQIPAFRVSSCRGVVKCSHRMQRLSAVPGYDYEEHSGSLTFEDKAGLAFMDVTILPKSRHEVSDQFQLVLEDAEGGLRFNPYDDGGDVSCILTVTIINDTNRPSWRALRLLDKILNVDWIHEVLDLWWDQIVGACFCNGSIEAQSTADVGDWIMHLAMIPWKLAYAITCPPPEASWICLYCSLAHIGIITTAVCDLAELFGCVLQIEDSITAITFVALGTSLPDLFASHMAAQTDEYADASIVNVTGSNSVNVFLGVGLSWSIGAIYWNQKGTTTKWLDRYGADHSPGEFIVSGENLTFSVIIFIIAAAASITTLIGRRRAFGGELGGPRGAKVMTLGLLLTLWVWYIVLSVWNSSGHRTRQEQTLIVLGATTLLAGIMLILGVCMNLVAAMTVQMDVEEVQVQPGQKTIKRSQSYIEMQGLVSGLKQTLNFMPGRPSAYTSAREMDPGEDSGNLRNLEAQPLSGPPSKYGKPVSGPIGREQVLGSLNDVRQGAHTWLSALDSFETHVRGYTSESGHEGYTSGGDVCSYEDRGDMHLPPLLAMGANPKNAPKQQQQQ